MKRTRWPKAGSETVGGNFRSAPPLILVLNGGSTSIRFAVFSADATPRRILAGKVENAGTGRARLKIEHSAGGRGPEPKLGRSGATGAGLLRWLRTQPLAKGIAIVGHRVVHGGDRDEPAAVSARLLRDLRRLSPADPDHLPAEIALIRQCARIFGGVRQIACFDTAFHRTLPPVARVVPLPRRGLVRRGFHGLSYEYLMGELARLAPAEARGRVILAHLGGGASLAAVRHGRCLETTMAVTPASGLVMGTRSGDLDPGLGYLLARSEGLTPAAFQHMVNHESGLLAISGTSADVRELTRREARDPRARLALDYFCRQAAKGIGALATVLGGCDTLVFSGGIGENSPKVRARICAALAFLGAALDQRKNRSSRPVISRPGSRMRLRVIPTDEELVIARACGRFLKARSRG